LFELADPIVLDVVLALGLMQQCGALIGLAATDIKRVIAYSA
jgi:NADH:ubiquinone oxidoreductase subunit 5 (subunit L)/multisubunit Na+/H+ antiporter MnhA subunit